MPEDTNATLDTTTPALPGVPAIPVAAASRTTRGRTSAAPRAAPKRASKPTPKKELEALRKELAAVRQELAAARREVGEVVTACRDAETRVGAARADADAIRRAVADVDASAATARGLAEAAAAEVRRAREQFEDAALRAAGLRATLLSARDEFAALGAESQRTLDQFRAAINEMRGVPEPEADAIPEAAPGLSDVVALAREERAGDLRDRLIHALADAWTVEKEQVGVLQTLADESGDRDLRVLLEEHRAAARERQTAVEGRLDALDGRPASGRGLLGQLATRVWDAVQAPRDQGDRAVLALPKAASAAEFAAAMYVAAHALARSAGDADTADLAVARYTATRDGEAQLRASIAPAAVRLARG
jgi:ferritin-like metal-binding protein YciE